MYSLKGIVFGGQIKGFPHPVVHEMMKQQVLQGNKADHTVFENNVMMGEPNGGFDWDSSTQEYSFWNVVVKRKNFKHFFDELREGTIEFAPPSSLLGKSDNKPLVQAVVDTSGLRAGDIVYISDSSDEDAKMFESKRVFLRKEGKQFICTDQRAWEESGKTPSKVTKTSSWLHAVKI